MNCFAAADKFKVQYRQTCQIGTQYFFYWHGIFAPRAIAAQKTSQPSEYVWKEGRKKRE